MRKVFIVIFFVGCFLIYQFLFGWLISNRADDYTFANQIFGFLFVVFTGKWFLKYNNKWFYVFSVSGFYIILSFLIKDFSRGGIMDILLMINIYLSFKALENKSFIKNGVIVLLISLFGSYLVFPNYFQLYQAHINKKETKISQDFPDIDLTGRNKEKFVFDNNKIIVLDFWTTSCGVCFKEFPLYNDLTLKYKNDNRIEFYSVNVPLKRDVFEKSVEMIEEYNYSFKNTYAVSEKEILEKLNIYAFPNIVIIKNNTIVYQGHPSYNKIIIVDNFESIIKNLLKD